LQEQPRLAQWVHTARTTTARSLGAYCKKKQQRLGHCVHTARESEAWLWQVQHRHREREIEKGGN